MPVSFLQLFTRLVYFNRLIPGWSCAISHPLEIPRDLVVLSVLRALSGIDQGAREGLILFESLLYELDGRAPPVETIADMIETRIRGKRRACATEYFSIFCRQGPGDIALRCRRPDLIALANDIIACAFSPHCPTNRYAADRGIPTAQGSSDA